MGKLLRGLAREPWGARLFRILALTVATLAILVSTLVTGARTTNDPITFTAAVPNDSTLTDQLYLVTCQPLTGPGHGLPVQLWDRDRRRGTWNSDVYGGLTRDQMLSYSYGYINGWHTEGEFDTEAAEWALYNHINESTGFYCGQLRENRQTSLINTYGVGILLLSTVAVAALVTSPSRQRPKGEV